MNQKTYKIWKYMLANPNVWLSVYDMSSDLKLTFRQCISVLSGINSEHIQKEHTKGGIIVCLDVDDATHAELRKKVIWDYYDIDKSFVDLITTVLPSCGWISITDIAADTGLKPIKISAALSTMTNVDHKCIGAMQMYSRRMA